MAGNAPDRMTSTHSEVLTALNHGSTFREFSVFYLSSPAAATQTASIAIRTVRMSRMNSPCVSGDHVKYRPGTMVQGQGRFPLFLGLFFFLAASPSSTPQRPERSASRHTVRHFPSMRSTSLR